MVASLQNDLHLSRRRIGYALICALLVEQNGVWQEREYLDMDDSRSGRLPGAC